MLYLGVDPGAKGAIATVDSYGILVNAWDMPVVDGVVSARLLGDLIRSEILDDGSSNYHAAVERVGSMPGQGVASTFKFGTGYGVVLGVLAGSDDISVMHPTPGKWKRDMGVTSDKETSRRKALDMWPEHAALFRRKMDEGRAEAALIARWCWVQVNR